MTKKILKRLLAEREQEIAELNRELKDKNYRISCMYDKLQKFITQEDGTPEDCKRGKWCGACEFGRAYHIGYGPDRQLTYFCGKGKACSNFVQKQIPV